MARPDKDKSYDVKSSGSVGPISPATASPGGPSIRSVWTPKFLSKITQDDLKNRCLVNVFVKNRKGALLNPILAVVSGGHTVDDVFGMVLTELKKDGTVPVNDMVSAVFHTVEDHPLLIPSGTRIAALIETNMLRDGTTVELESSLVEYNPGQPFVISAPVEHNSFPVPVSFPEAGTSKAPLDYEEAPKEKADSSCAGNDPLDYEESPKAKAGLAGIAFKKCTICDNQLIELCMECQLNQTSANIEQCTPTWGVCNHAFHLHCIRRWLKTRHVCPIDKTRWEYQD